MTAEYDPGEAPPPSGSGGILTDGGGVAPLDTIKVVKDLVADFLLSGAAAGVAAGIFTAIGTGDDLTAREVAAFAVGGAAVRLLYRAVLRWASA